MGLKSGNKRIVKHKLPKIELLTVDKTAYYREYGLF
ncbi:hypothetical protein TUN_32740 [Bacillus sp. M21]|nr:hypothetical protein TUN_32740 [Bacillus sp. M21]